MKTMQDIFDSVCKWNAARYEREYNHELSIALLREEHQEYFDSESLVEQLDALADICYVALGVLWKLNLEQETFDFNTMEAQKQVAKMLDTNTVYPIYFIGSVIDACHYDSDYPAALAMHKIVCLAMTQMSAMGLTPEEQLEALAAVCKSNDSKSIKKVASDVKANDGDKGEFYVSPTVALTKIIKGIEERYNA